MVVFKHYQQVVVYISIGIFFVLGILFRFHNISPFKFYPDAYQSLLVAQNIRTYHDVVGYLGPQGMLFPEFSMWTRPGYPLFINFFKLFFSDFTASAQIISFLAGILSLPLVFLLCRRVFKSSLYGVAGIGLLAFSFEHTVWSGFIMTETIGVFFLLSFLVSFFSNLTKKPLFADPVDVISGLLIGCACITRYEYSILLLPVFSLVFVCSPQPFVRILNISTAFLLFFSIVLSQLFPLQTIGNIVVPQLSKDLFYAGVVGMFFIISGWLFWKVPTQYKEYFVDKLCNLSIGVIWLFAGYVILQYFIGSSLTFLLKDLDFVRTFFAHEILITLFSLTGCTLLLRSKKYRVIGCFVLFSVIPLLVIYHNVNPTMDRYLTHLLPFLLILASYGLVKTGEKIVREFYGHKLLGILLVLLMTGIGIYQGYLTVNGVRNWRDKSWFSLSYEEQAAHLAKPYLIDKNALLLVSFPESYFYFLQMSTHSVSDSYPYIFIPDSFNSKPIYIILDMGMVDLFPHFVRVLKSVPKKQIAVFWVRKPYHFGYRSVPEKTPVAIYETTVGELKTYIKQHQK